MSKNCSAKWNFTAIVFLAVSVMFSLLFVACGDDDEGATSDKGKTESTTESGFYTLPSESIGDWDEGIYYHDKTNEKSSYYIVSKKDTADHTILICLSHATNNNTEDALLLNFNEDCTIKDIFLAGYTFEAHSKEDCVQFVAFDKDFKVVGNFNVPYKTFDDPQNATTRSPFLNSKGEISVTKVLNIGKFLNTVSETIGIISDLADGRFGDVALDFSVGKLVGIAKLPWYYEALAVEGTKRFIQTHYKRFQNHFIGSAEIEITSIKRESETSITVSGVIKNAASIPTSRLTTDGYTRNIVLRGVAMGKWGYPGLYVNDQCTNLIQVNQNDDKFSYTFYQETVPGQVYYFRPFLAPEATMITENDVIPPFDTCIRYGERKRFLDMDVDLSNFKQNSCKKEGDKYVVQFSIHGKIPGTFDELSNWGFDIKTKSGSYTNRYYAKTSDTYSPPTSKDFSCEVTLTKQDIEEYNNEYISTITITPFAMYWNQSPSMESFEPETYTLSLTETSCPDSNHPHWIDLGLPSGTKWACCNVGASAPEDYGNYYAWGETQPKSVYNFDTYQYYNSNTGYMNIGNDIAGTSYDAATANWGAPWRMPSLTQIKELLKYTTSTWTTENGVNGRKFTGSNGGSIFLPAAGYRWDSGLFGADSDGDYWSSSLNEGSPYYLGFAAGNAILDGRDPFSGPSVRPVR